MGGTMSGGIGGQPPVAGGGPSKGPKKISKKKFKILFTLLKARTILFYFARMKRLIQGYSICRGFY